MLNSACQWAYFSEHLEMLQVVTAKQIHTQLNAFASCESGFRVPKKPGSFLVTNVLSEEELPEACI